jgi:alpha-beta hydrolase superfamily lysophospholipase
MSVHPEADVAAPAAGMRRLSASALWTAIAGLTLGGAATGVARFFQGGKPAADLTVTSVIVFLSVSAAGALSWWLLITRRRRVSEGRGAMAGALTALLGYLLVYQASHLVYGLASPGFYGDTLPERIAGGLMIALVTLIFSGWFMLPLLALTGTLLALGQIALSPGLERSLLPRLQSSGRRAIAFLRGRPLVQALVTGLTLLGLLVTMVGTWVWTRPLFVGDLVTTPAPVTDYETSVAAIRAQIAAEQADPALNPLCVSRLLTPGRHVERVVVFFHGFTNCPAQFAPLGEQLAARGYAVYIPRLPRHGYADRLTDNLAGLTANELVGFTSRSVDLAQGLGAEVIVAGLSAGGTLAAWAAQSRDDVAQVVLIAPLFHIVGLPPFSIRPAASTILAVPNFYMWWDNEAREQAIGTPYGYPRYPVHAVGALLRLSFAVQDRSERAAPAVREILLVSNEADGAISNTATETFADVWRRSGASVRAYTFPAELALDHDVIDPNHPEQRVELVYPILIDLIEEKTP